MRINLFAAVQEDEDNSIFSKLMMGLMLGMAIGWVLLRYRRQEVENGQWERKSTTSDGEIEITEAVLAEEEAEEENSEQASKAQPSSSEAPVAKKTSSDKLEAIKGIGPVFARRLNAAGINTYQQLVDTPPEKIRAIVDAKPWQAVEPEEWVAQARELT